MKSVKIKAPKISKSYAEKTIEGFKSADKGQIAMSYLFTIYLLTNDHKQDNLKELGDTT